MLDALLRSHGKLAYGAIYPELGYPQNTIGETDLSLDAGPWSCDMVIYLLDEFTFVNGSLCFKVFVEDFTPLPGRTQVVLPEKDDGLYGVYGYVSLDSTDALTIQLRVLDEPGDEDEYPSWDPVFTDMDTQPTLVSKRGAFYCTIVR